jgi:hypothetical protein
VIYPHFGPVPKGKFVFYTPLSTEIKFGFSAKILIKSKRFELP